MVDKTINNILLVFVSVVVGIALFLSLLPDINRQTELQFVLNETRDITAGRIVNGSSINDIATWINFTVDNVPGGTAAPFPVNITEFAITTENTTAVLNTDYLFNGSNGRFTLLNTSLWHDERSNTTYLNYTYQHVDYFTSQANRSLIGLIVIFFAIGILLVAAIVVFKSRIFEKFG